MDKEKSLATIAKEINECIICKKDTIGKAVVGEGNPDASVMFIGEAPGKKEAETGRPFVGKSGQLLRKAISEIGLSEKYVFITSAVKYLPRTKTPSKEDIAHARPYLFQQIKIIQPKILVLLGRVACESVLQQPISVAKEHGNIIKQDGYRCFVSYHPAAALRFLKIRNMFLEDFQKLGRLYKEIE